MNKKSIIICSAVMVLILIMAGAGIFITRNSADTPDRLLSLGEKYLTELNYEQALVQFLKVIEIDPMNPRGYTGAAEAYVGLGQTGDAVAVLRQGLGLLPDNTDIKQMLDGLTMPEETVEPIDDVLVDTSDETQMSNGAVEWSVNDWVFGGISVFDGTAEAIAEVLGGELRYVDDYFGLGAVTIIATNISENGGFSHGGLYVNSSGQFGQVSTDKPGVSAIYGITIGETTLDDALELFPIPNTPIERDERGIGALSVSGEKGVYTWLYNAEESNSSYDGDTERPYALLFYAEVEGLDCNYSVRFTEGMAENIWFENIGLMSKASN